MIRPNRNKPPHYKSPKTRRCSHGNPSGVRYGNGAAPRRPAHAPIGGLRGEEYVSLVRPLARERRGGHVEKGKAMVVRGQHLCAYSRPLPDAHLTRSRAAYPLQMRKEGKKPLMVGLRPVSFASVSCLLSPRFQSIGMYRVFTRTTRRSPGTRRYPCTFTSRADCPCYPFPDYIPIRTDPLGGSYPTINSNNSIDVSR